MVTRKKLRTGNFKVEDGRETLIYMPANLSTPVAKSDVHLLLHSSDKEMVSEVVLIWPLSVSNTEARMSDANDSDPRSAAVGVHRRHHWNK